MSSDLCNFITLLPEGKFDSSFKAKLEGAFKTQMIDDLEDLKMATADDWAVTFDLCGESINSGRKSKIVHTITTLVDNYSSPWGHGIQGTPLPPPQSAQATTGPKESEFSPPSLHSSTTTVWSREAVVVRPAAAMTTKEYMSPILALYATMLKGR